jgi:hypothetical protein
MLEDGQTLSRSAHTKKVEIKSFVNDKVMFLGTLKFIKEK